MQYANQDEYSLYEYNQAKVKEELSSAIDVLAKVSPANQQVKISNSIIIQHLKQQKSLNVLLSLLIFAQGDNTRCSLIISFISFYLRQQVRIGVGTVRHNKKMIYQKIKALFFCNSISQKHKRMLQNGFSQFLSTLSTEFMKIRRILCEQIVEYFLKEVNITTSDLQNVLYLIQSVLSANLQIQSLRLLQQNLLANFVKLSLKLVRQIDITLTKDPSAYNISQEEHNKIIWTLKVIKITQLLYVSGNHDKIIVLKNQIMISTQLAHLCSIALMLSNNHNGFMIFQQKCTSYWQINQIKCHVLKIMNDSIKTINKGKKNLSHQKYIPVLETVSIFIKKVVKNLAIEMSGFPTNQNKHDEQLLKQTILLLSRTAQIQVLINQHTSIRDLILFNICLPCFIVTKKDRQLMAEDFCQKKQKIIDNDGTSKNLQQAAAHLVQAYADNIYGTVSYLVQTLINLMDFHLTADPRYFQKLPQTLINSQFYKDHNFYEQIQVGLSIIALLSYHADHRHDLSILVQAFIVRRQVFFSRIDVPVELIVSFLYFSAYYLENFYTLILEGKANANFHQSLLFHAIQLLGASYDEQKRDYKNNDTKKIGIQALDYIGNALIQPFFFSAVFPAWNTQSGKNLSVMIQRICRYFSAAFNIYVLQNVLIDFVVRVIDRHLPEGNNFAQMPKMLKNQVGYLVLDNIIKNFNPEIKNQTIAKPKMMELYSLFIRIADNPVDLLQKGMNLLNHILQKEYSYLDDALDVLQILFKRVIKQTISVSQQVKNISARILLKAMKVCDNQKFQTVVFDLILSFNFLKFFQQELTQCLVQIFSERLQEKEYDQDAQVIMQKVLYLLMQIAFNNFELVSSQTWLNILQRMIDYMRVYYVRQDTITIGKASCISLCCYIQNPQGIQAYLFNRSQGFWDCVIDDQLKFSSQTQKKVACILLCRLLGQYSNMPNIKNRFPQILKTVCIIMYYIYEKNQISYRDDSSDYSEDNIDNKSQKSAEKRRQWRQQYYTMRSNVFLSSLPDERVLLRDICTKLNETDHNNFQKFIIDLPIGIQNLVKYKILMYREDSAVSAKTKMRTIYKVKRMQLSN